jgi:hypothetical protein
MVSSDATVKTCLAMYPATEFFPMYSLVYTSTGTTIIIILICYTRSYFFIRYFTNGALSRRYQGRYILIQLLEKRKKDSKKNEGNIRQSP